MLWYTRVAWGMAVYSVSVSASVGQQPPAKPEAKVELRWVECKHTEGVTDPAMSFQASCDPDDVVCPHEKPALMLTPAAVADVSFTNSDLSRNGLSSDSPSFGFFSSKAEAQQIVDALK